VTIVTFENDSGQNISIYRKEKITSKVGMKKTLSKRNLKVILMV